MDCGFYVISKKALPNLKSGVLLFSSRSFIVLGFMFRSMIHFELIFVYVAKYCWGSIFIYLFIYLFIYFWPRCAECRTLVPQSLNHWTAGEVPRVNFFFLEFLNFILFIFLYSRLLLVIYFIYISVYMSIPISQFIPLY